MNKTSKVIHLGKKECEDYSRFMYDKFEDFNNLLEFQKARNQVAQMQSK